MINLPAIHCYPNQLDSPTINTSIWIIKHCFPKSCVLLDLCQSYCLHFYEHYSFGCQFYMCLTFHLPILCVSYISLAEYCSILNCWLADGQAFPLLQFTILWFCGDMCPVSILTFVYTPASTNDRSLGKWPRTGLGRLTDNSPQINIY